MDFFKCIQNGCMDSKQKTFNNSGENIMRAIDGENL